jgi:hypothetical protein
MLTSSHAKGFRFGYGERHHHGDCDVRHEIEHDCYLAGGGDLIKGEGNRPHGDSCWLTAR